MAPKTTADDLDPGPDAAGVRAAEVETAAAEPIDVPGGGHIRVGTASWTDPTMTAAGVFYPASATTAEERLQHYAATFPLVEVDATYYALPSAATAKLWVERTPPDFIFDIKAHALMTGQGTETKRLPKALREALPEPVATKARVYAKDLPPDLLDAVWATFRDGLEPLAEAGQLGSILLQFPRWFFPSSENRATIEDAVERLDGLACAVEFRNASWLNEKNAERTLRFLRDRQIAFVMVDEPQGFKSSVPPVTAVTSDLALVRFHGRNRETWEAKGITPAERFRYLYSRDELEAWAPKIREVATEARETHVLMNNCYANYGTTNAREIAALLAEDLPAGD
ncbi:MAG: hypothetical protein QOE66_1847 [Chloroflexota bacterium]|nr:hypothetical protein [Chloroflexota bacterium]